MVHRSALTLNLLTHQPNGAIVWNEQRGAFVQHYDSDVLDAFQPAHAARQVHRAHRPVLALDAGRDGREVFATPDCRTPVLPELAVDGLSRPAMVEV